MKTLRIIEPGKAEWQETDIPDPSVGEALVKVHGVTTCPQWDLHIMSGEPMFEGMEMPYPYYPGQPGHEMTGEVVEATLDKKRLPTGKRVVVWRDAGPARAGAYAEYVCIPEENLFVIPDHLEVDEIASLELAMCVQVSFDQLEDYSGMSGVHLGITGMGPAGLVALQIGRAMGAERITVYDLVDERRRLAESLGADEALDPSDEDRSDRFLDVAVDTSGAKQAVDFLIEHTLRAVTLFGVLRDRVGFGPSHWYGGFGLLGYGEHNVAAGRRALKWVLSGELDLSALVSATLPMKDYEKGVDLLESKEAIKVLFIPTD